MSDTVGSIAELWRFPVKSMLGEKLDAAELTERGLEGDRASAHVDARPAERTASGESFRRSPFPDERHRRRRTEGVRRERMDWPQPRDRRPCTAPDGHARSAVRDADAGPGRPSKGQRGPAHADS